MLGRHALRNALIPMVTVLGVLTPRLLGGAVVTETIFAWPGLGRLAVEAAVTRDYPVILGATLLVSALVVLSNLITDLLYVVIDPRIALRDDHRPRETVALIRPLFSKGSRGSPRPSAASPMPGVASGGIAWPSSPSPTSWSSTAWRRWRRGSDSRSPRPWIC